MSPSLLEFVTAGSVAANSVFIALTHSQGLGSHRLWGCFWNGVALFFHDDDDFGLPGDTYVRTRDDYTVVIE